jgi:hypothetical protein
MLITLLVMDATDFLSMFSTVSDRPRGRSGPHGPDLKAWRLAWTEKSREKKIPVHATAWPYTDYPENFLYLVSV